MTTINATLGSYPGLPFAAAMSRALDDTHLAQTEHVQLCPQNHGALDAALDDLRDLSPGTRYRLHANVRVEGHARHFDASHVGADADAYFRRLAEMSALLGADAYTLHAGERQGRPLEELFTRIRRLEDLMGIAVGVEGHYPEAGNKWWLSNWAEYAWLLASGLDYALDLSHLNICAVRSGTVDLGLTRELLASEHCIEVHLSSNDGFSDLHCPLSLTPDIWWVPLLPHANPAAVTFYEGNEMRGPGATERIQTRINQRRRTPRPVDTRTQ